MNTVQLVGRLTRDVDMRYTAGENAMATARFSVAVNRRFKNADGGYDADFPGCVAFGKTAEFVNQWFHKGDLIGVTGRLQTGSYVNKDGVKVYTTDVVVDNVEFVGGKNAGSDQNTPASQTSQNTTPNFMNIPDDANGPLPF